jgi:DNA mismatch repair protein MutS2
MDEKTIKTLEFHKILEQLAGYAAFSASAELIRGLRPTSDLDEARRRQCRTTETRHLLTVHGDLSVGGASDIRPLVDIAAHGGVLEPGNLLDIKSTLISARDLSRTFERLGDQYPTLADIAAALPPPPGLIDFISRAISDRGEVLDSASDKLGSIRRELKVAHERLLARLERLINDSRTAPMLQEAIITQRNGRYVIPLRSEFKGRMRSIIHDQSASGATLFVEPLGIVDMNNAWHELQLAERDEIRRILAELSEQVGRAAAAINTLVQALAELDVALCCANYAEDLHASEPVLEDFKPRADHPGGTVRLFQARHPLLDPATAVPIDIDMDERTFTVIITGPNTGGKTVTLKTLGLLALMAQTGLHIPAQSGSTLSVFHNIYADIGDEQSIEQSLSTFSSHITNIVRILKRATPQALVLLDELGAGTDPQEGAALARAILAYLIGRRITCLVATHYPELKAYAHNTPGVINASMEFNLQTLRPTYHLTIGLPGRSNALLIAERLGLPEEITQAARSTLDPNDLKAEDLLDEIHRQRDLARGARSAAENARRDAERLRTELARRLEKVEDERQALLEQARAESEKQVLALKEELDDIRRSLNRARQPLEALKPVMQQVEDLESKTEKPVERRSASGVVSAMRPLRLGDRVRVRSLQMDGLVTALGEEEIEVQLGNLRVRVRLSEIQRAGEPEVAAPEPTAASRRRHSKPASDGGVAQHPAGIGGTATIFHPSPGMELDLRGQRAEDALDALDRYLESAFLAGLPFVRIIHGKGTGKLRQAVREMLQGHAHVAAWETGQEKEGGDGVTVAKLK